VLSDADKRARYDRFGAAGLGGGGAQGFDPSVFGDFSDILGDLFGLGDPFGARRRGRGGASPGADLRYDLILTFEEAAFGCTKALEIPRLESCAECGGSGAKKGSGPTPCTACGGRGQVRFNQGFLTVARTCPQCRGTGSVIRDPCARCRGEGRIERERKLEVTIPAGVDTGARLRLSGEGEDGRLGGPRGDLYVVLGVEPAERFERDGPHVHARLDPGGSCRHDGRVETIHGAVPFDVPRHAAGPEPAARQEIAAGPRRQAITSHVVLPVPTPSKRAPSSELLRRLAELEGQPVREDKGVSVE
jgi:molecular chaperone DnaJ